MENKILYYGLIAANALFYLFVVNGMFYFYTKGLHVTWFTLGLIYIVLDMELGKYLWDLGIKQGRIVTPKMAKIRVRVTKVYNVILLLSLLILVFLVRA